MDTGFQSLDWYKEIGKPKTDSPIYNQVQNKTNQFEKKEFKDKDGVHEYYFSYNDGISLGFSHEILSSVFLYGQYDKKFKCYSGTLPYSLNFTLTNADIVGFLGEPTKKAGGGSTPISLSYERVGIEITFMSPVWDLIDNKISFICLFQPKKDNDNLICSLCRKKSENFCGQCHLVSYCSQNCQKVHWKVHKILCNQFSKAKM